jgi:hypothetical protein
LTDDSGNQHVYIAPEAFSVAKAEFADQLDYWQNALPDYLKGNLESVCCFDLSSAEIDDVVYQISGARLLEINGADPYVSVNANAKITGGFQSLGTRQNRCDSAYWCSDWN